MSRSDPRCRSCGAALTRTLVDLGEQPLANAYLTDAQLSAGREPSYPLHARVCDTCWLVQVDDVVPPEAIFTEYAYFSSYSDSWVEHSRRYCKQVIDRLGLDHQSLVIEVASNDGYLLRHFVDEGVPVLGVEPAANVAEVARAAGVPTEVRFFGWECAADLVDRGQTADLVVANNVLAHVPDLDDFIRGLAGAMKPGGALTIEVPHLLRMLERVEFDTIYHEHFSYFSLLAACHALKTRGLRVFDVEELSTHGGSMRLWIGLDATCPFEKTEAVDSIIEAERTAGLDQANAYAAFAGRVEHARASLRGFLVDAREAGKRVAAYGAAAKGNTLLNSCHVTTSDVAYVVDRNPHKQGQYLPGSHLPILEPDHVRRDRPDYLLILPWNLREEITEQMADVHEWGCRFVVAIPEVEVLA
ncbi:MAG: class I SAM-dependent methyltransferase [Acidimicrobiia bacterium]